MDLKNSPSKQKPAYESLSDPELRAECFAVSAKLAEDLQQLSRFHTEYWKLIRLPGMQTNPSAQPIESFEQQGAPDTERLDVRMPWDKNLSLSSRMGAIPSSDRAEKHSVALRRLTDHQTPDGGLYFVLGFDKGDVRAKIIERLCSLTLAAGSRRVANFHRSDTDRPIDDLERDTATYFLRFCDRLHEAVISHMNWLELNRPLAATEDAQRKKDAIRNQFRNILGSAIVGS